MQKNEILKHVKLGFYSIYFFFKIVKKSRLPLFFINYIYIHFIIYMNIYFVNNILIPFLSNLDKFKHFYNLLIIKKFKSLLFFKKCNHKYITLFSNKEILKINIYKDFISKLLVNTFNRLIFYQKLNVSNLFEFQNVKILLLKNLIFNNVEKIIFNNISVLFLLLNFNIMDKNMFNSLFLKEMDYKRKIFVYFLKNSHKKNIYFFNTKKYKEIFLLPFNLKKKKIKLKHLKLFESIYFFKFIRRFRTIFFLFIFYLYIFWFNKFLIKINFNKNKNIIMQHNIKIFNNLKIRLGLNIKHVWLNFNISIPFFNLNYLLYNNIIKKQW